MRTRINLLNNDNFLYLLIVILLVSILSTKANADTADATCCEYYVTDGQCGWNGFNSWSEGGAHPVLHKVEKYCVQVKKGEGQKCDELTNNELYFLEGECSRIGARANSDNSGAGQSPRYASVVGVRSNVEIKERHFCTKYRDFTRDPENGFHYDGIPKVENLWSKRDGWGVTITFGYCSRTKPGKGGSLETADLEY